MCDKAWEWAKAKKKIRCNPVHGEEEINIVLSETFELEDVSLEETNQAGSFEVEENVEHACLSYHTWSRPLH